jgi:hypothetical protein
MELVSSASGRAGPRTRRSGPGHPPGRLHVVKDADNAVTIADRTDATEEPQQLVLDFAVGHR